MVEFQLDKKMVNFINVSQRGENPVYKDVLSLWVGDDYCEIGLEDLAEALTPYLRCGKERSDDG